MGSELSVDASVAPFKKVVAIKKTKKYADGTYAIQGRMYVHHDFVDRQFLLMLLDPINDTDEAKVVDFDGEPCKYYEMLVRPCKLMKNGEKYRTGYVSLPKAWVNKNVLCLLLVQ